MPNEDEKIAATISSDFSIMLRLSPMKLFLLLSLFITLTAHAARFLPTKHYQYAVGEIPRGLTDQAALQWLEKQPKPKLSKPDPKFDKAFRGALKVPADAVIEIAVLGPPRVSGVADPKFYVWAVTKDKKGNLLTEGAGRFALSGSENEDEATIDVLGFFPRKALTDEPSLIERTFPVDATTLLRKMLSIDK